MSSHLKKFFFLASFLTLASFNISASEYPFMSIPSQLVKNANAVIRLQEQVIEIHSLGKITVKDRRIVTILNESGDHHAYLVAGYSKMVSIDKMDGTLFDAAGNKIRSLKKSEIKDENYTISGQMIDDNRYKYHNFYHRTYPYTVAYELEYSQSQSLSIPDWTPLRTRGVSVMQSSYTAIMDKDYQLRTREYNISSPAVISNNGSKKILKWSISNHPAIVGEYAAPSIEELAPHITISPSAFRIDDFNGSLSSWEDYGNFYAKLNAGRDQLPEATKLKVKQLVEGLKSDEEKVKKIYNYLQQTTRYVGVQLGIGGLRTFPASYVVENGYGDCKALSNYMVAMLKEAGIKAHYVLIGAGDDVREFPADFPSDNFNHIVCAVPLKNDTMWLECTSQTKAAGYMGSFTGNRNALLVTDAGGKLVRTPAYRKDDNLFWSKVTATLETDGSLRASLINHYQALCSDDVHARIHHYSKEELQKYLKKNIDLPDYDLISFDYKEFEGKLPVIKEDLHIIARNYAQFSGKRLFILPNIGNRWSTKINTDTARLYKIELTEERIENDTVHITIPPGYLVESKPKNVDLKTPFGSYNSTIEYIDGKIIYHRRLELNKGNFSATAYNDLVAFYDNIYKSDNSRVVLKKSE